MSDAPERIKAWPWNGRTYAGQWHVEGQGDTTEYIRADIHAARIAEITRLRARIKAADRLAALMALVFAASQQTARDRDLSEVELAFMRDVDAALSAYEEAGK